MKDEAKKFQAFALVFKYNFDHSSLSPSSSSPQSSSSVSHGALQARAITGSEQRCGSIIRSAKARTCIPNARGGPAVPGVFERSQSFPRRPYGILLLAEREKPDGISIDDQDASPDRGMVRLNASVHPSLSDMVIEKLRRKNVITIVDFIAMNSLKLATSTELSYTDILQMKRHISKKFGAIKKNAAELLVAESNDIIRTNSSLDELLKNGLCLGQLYELCGSSSSGKTQLCLTIAANVAATQSDVIVWYFDTKADFSKLRFVEILEAKRYRQEVITEALQRIQVCYVRSSRELIRALRQLICLCKKEGSSIEEKKLLVIIDSLPAVIFKVTRYNSQNHKTTHELDDLAETCRFLSKECRAAVITVNSVTRWSTPEHTGLVAPALGKYWMTIPATRLLLTRQQDEARRIIVWKNLQSNSENSYCNVMVTDAGVIPR